MKRTTYASVIFLLLLALCLRNAHGAPLEESIAAQLEELGLEGLMGYSELVDPDFRAYLPKLDLKGILAGGEGGAGVGELFRQLLALLLQEVVVSLALLRQLVVVAALSALLTQLGGSFGETAVINLAKAICFLVIIILGLQSCRAALALAADTIDKMVSFMYAILPMLASLLAAAGGVTSAVIFHPVLVAMVGAVASTVRYVLLPLIFGGAVIGLLAHFSTELPLSRLAGLARQVTVTLMGLLFVVFSGVMAVRGAISPIADGIGIRTAKFLTKTFVPVVGGMFSDAVEVVAGGSLLIKNAVGAFGLAMVFFLMAVPVLKLWAVVLIYKAVNAVTQPIVDERVVAAIASLEHSLTLVLAALATAGLMFFLVITVLVGLGNLTAVLR
ncbi:MAG TPA: stage III sporulation protein AE [Firmicutes bacterium]|jgi:stage III sporulation protein AE|nr:stage III sporulation protein AE [Bacillota bacterium]